MRLPLNSFLIVLVLIEFRSWAAAADEFEAEPIRYSATTPDNVISRLQTQLEARATSLTYEPRFGYLKGVLTALDVPADSQSLVFSKTSLQIRRISPQTPRAIYFNDDVYIGFIPGSDVLEISVADPVLGAVFYTLDQRPEPVTGEGRQSDDAVPRFARRNESCLICHASSRTDGIPGHLMRSVLADKSGHPVSSSGSRLVHRASPLDQRFGGWYVTGKHGSQQHLGNLMLGKDAALLHVENEAGQNVVDLGDRFDTSRYLTPHSDLVALLLLDHQVLVHNRITAAGFATRQALAYDRVMREFLKQPADELLESTQRRIQSACEKLAEALLFVDEIPFSEVVRGTSGFAERYSAAGPRTPDGRSLRDLDLTIRLFKYPLSPLIYSEAFRKLPDRAVATVWKRLDVILAGQDTSEKFAHLSTADCVAIREILQNTYPNCPIKPAVE